MLEEQAIEKQKEIEESKQKKLQQAIEKQKMIELAKITAEEELKAKILEAEQLSMLPPEEQERIMEAKRMQDLKKYNEEQKALEKEADKRLKAQIQKEK